jgi:hypothetical protein
METKSNGFIDINRQLDAMLFADDRIPLAISEDDLQRSIYNLNTITTK